MYTIAISVGSPSSSAQICHNYNTGLIYDLILLLLQILLLFLRILYEILLVADTVAEPIAMEGESATAGLSELPKHIVAAAEPLTSDYTMVMVRTVVGVKNVVTAV